MCGNYGCKNCKNHKVWYSHDYWSPDEHECIIGEFDKPAFDVSDKEMEDIFERVWCEGEEWDNVEEQICPFYNEYIPPYENF